MSIKISIITPSYNQGRFIKDTIESVLNQNYDNFEHIIIDGGSTDETISILKTYPHLIWISEKDSGPVDALTKGFSMATGKIATWLNSDDYFENNIFRDIENEFIDKNTGIVIGNMFRVNPEKVILSENINNEIYNFDYLTRVNSDIVKQPSTFFRKDLFFEAGGFDNSLKLVWDYDLFLKMFKLTKPKFVDKPFAYQRIYDTTISRRHARKQAIEIFRVAKRNGAKLTDKINKLVIIRFIFPSSISKNPNIIFKIIRYIKRKIRD